MEWIIAILTGPILGALIGWGTNYIAIKLMFRPLKPKYIGKFHLPMTPGMIPKNQAKLAKAIGKTVGNTLLTTEDIEKMLRSDAVKDIVCNETISELERAKKYSTVGDLAKDLAGEERYLKGKVTVEHFILDKIVSGVKKLDLEKLLLSDGGAAIKEQMKGHFLSLLITEDTLRAVAKPLSSQLHTFLDNNAQEVLLPIICEETAKLEDMNMGDLLDKLDISKEHLSSLILKVYEEVVLKKIVEIVRHFDLQGTVEEKINKMDVIEVENMLLSVIHRELNAVINLGAYIGFILGLVGMFVTMLI